MSTGSALGGSTALLSIRSLSVEFPTADGVVRAVDNVSFDVSPGEVVGLAGESGSGKSVMSLSVLRLLRGARVTGEVLFEGKDLLTASESRLRSVRGAQVGIVFQDPLSALNPVRSIGEQVAEALTIRGTNRKEARRRSIEMLGRVGFRNPDRRIDDYPHQFSGGMRQRVVIASAIISHPALLIADEPTTALDVVVQAQVLDLIHSLSEEMGMAVILISHDLGVLAGHADRIAIMYAGSLVETASTDEMYYAPAHPYTWGLLGSVPQIGGPARDRLATIPGQPPSALDVPAGCRFNPRCRYSQPVCKVQEPALRNLGAGRHQAACHFAGAIVPPEGLPARPVTA